MDAPLPTPLARVNGHKTGFFSASLGLGLVFCIFLLISLALILTDSGLWSREIAQSSLLYSVLMAPVASLSHFDWNHLVLNYAAFGLVLWGFSAVLSARVLMLSYLVLSSGVLAAVALFSDFSHYAGLSGVLHGWFAICAVFALAINKTRNLGVVLIVGAVLKLVLEAHGMLFEQASSQIYAVAHIAHQAGFGTGIFFALGALSLGSSKRFPR